MDSNDPAAAIEFARDEVALSLRDVDKAINESMRGHYPFTKFDTKNRKLAGRSASRRMKYGYHSVPYGT